METLVLNRHKKDDYTSLEQKKPKKGDNYEYLEKNTTDQPTKTINNAYLTGQELGLILAKTDNIFDLETIHFKESFFSKYSYTELDHIHNILRSRLQKNTYNSPKIVETIIKITGRINRILDYKSQISKQNKK